MTLIILPPDNFISPSRVVLDGRRKVHAETVQRVQEGDCLRVGKLNGLIESALFASILRAFELDVTFTESPPTTLTLTLLLTLPRPKRLKRILQTVSSMGAKLST